MPQNLPNIIANTPPPSLSALTLRQLMAYVRSKQRPNAIDGRLLTHIDEQAALIEDMAGPVVAWAQACARQASLPPGTFRPDHQALIDRINTAMKETTDV